MLSKGVILLFAVCFMKLHISCNADFSAITAIFKEAPKLWMKYLKRLIFEVISDRKLLITEVFLATCQKSFGLVLHKNFNYFAAIQNRKGEHLMGLFQPRTVYSFIKGATGSLLFPFGAPSKKLQYIVLFTMATNLSLTLFLDSIVFYTRRKGCRKYYFQVSLAQNQESFIYCGQHSQFYLYLQGRTAVLTIVIQPYLPFHLNTSFQVNDENLVYSISNTRWPTLQSGHVFKNGQSHLEFKLKTQKQNILSLNFSTKDLFLFVVFDGPGSLSQPLNSTQNLDTSTFQCLVLVISSLVSKHSFSFFTREVLSIQKILLRHSGVSVQLKLPYSHCSSSSLCLIQIIGENKYHINATIRHISYTGMQSPTCDFGGVTAIETVEEQTQDKLTVCEKYNLSAIGRNIYSKSSHLVLVLFRYKFYSKVEASFLFSLTACFVVHADPCNSIFSLHTDILFKTQTFEISGKGHDWMYSLSPKHCAVFSIYNINLKSKFSGSLLFGSCSKCKMRIVPKPIYAKEVELTSRISVAFHNQFLWTKTEEEFVKISGKPDHFQFQNMSQTEAKGKHTTLWLEQESLRRTKQFKTKFSNSFKQFYTFAKISTPIHKETLVFCLCTHFETNMWAELLISSASKNSTFKSILDLYLSDKLDFIPGSSLKVHRITTPAESHTQLLFLQVSKTISHAVEPEPTNILIYALTKIEREFYDWTKRISSMPWAFERLYSVPGCVQGISVEYRPQETPLWKNYSHFFQLNIIWLSNNYEKFYHLSTQPTFCENQSCYNFSSYQSEPHGANGYYVFFASVLQSWNEASRRCKVLGGQLPYFTNREHEEKFTTLIKLVQRFHLLEAVFIGIERHCTKVSCH